MSQCVQCPADISICCAGSALALQPGAQVGFALDLARCFASPGNTPVFVKKRRGTSRPLSVTDFKRNVESEAERSLFLECHALHTKGRHTDWLGLTREFNLRVTRMWQQTGSLSDLYLKDEQQLRLHEKGLIKQITAIEACRTSSAIAGLQAFAAAPVRPRLSQPVAGRGPASGGGGRGAPGRARECVGCSSIHGGTVPRADHNCAWWLLGRGLYPRSYQHAKTYTKHLLNQLEPNQDLPSAQDAQSITYSAWADRQQKIRKRKRG